MHRLFAKCQDKVVGVTGDSVVLAEGGPFPQLSWSRDSGSLYSVESNCARAFPWPGRRRRSELSRHT